VKRTRDGSTSTTAHNNAKNDAIFCLVVAVVVEVVVQTVCLVVAGFRNMSKY
jgi:hypothetical protein